jgi:phospholipase C
VFLNRLCPFYDENDGYFDHIPPFVPPAPNEPETGIASKGIDTSVDYAAPDEPIGLGFRVPMIVASPWSRGGCVCSQVFDHTSVLQFLEKFVTHKTGKPIRETNISPWRRTVCGDLTSVFKAASQKQEANPPFIPREPFFEQIDRAKYKPVPAGFARLTEEAVEQIRHRDPLAAKWLPQQEPGVRPSCPLPYELYVDGKLTADRKRFAIQFEVKNQRFGARSAGCPFIIYAITGDGEQVVRNYAVAAGDVLNDTWELSEFEGGKYHLRAYGPNGFFREFIGSASDPAVDVRVDYTTSGDVEVRAVNGDGRLPLTLHVEDMSYKAEAIKKVVAPGGAASLVSNAQHSFYWYDLSVKIESTDGFTQRFAGRVETGQWSFSDPAMGRAGT